MNKILHLFLGPELLWFFLYIIVLACIKLSGAPIKSFDSVWVSLAYIIPFILIPLTFSLYYVPGVIRPWLLLRIIITGIIGSHLILDVALQAHTEQGPGVGTAYIMGMVFTMVALFIGSVWAAIKF